MMEMPVIRAFFTALLFPFFVWSQAPITPANWGSLATPVYGSTDPSFPAGTELIAGPNKFGSYFSGVLPNGRVVKPAGISIQVGMNPLGAALTPDGKFLVTSNDSSHSALASQKNPMNVGGYSLSVIDTASMKVVSQFSSRVKLFVGLQVTGSGPYTVWASGGGDNQIDLFTLSASGELAKAKPDRIVIKPILPSTAGYVSNYTPGAALNAANANGDRPPAPTNFNRTAGAHTTFPASSALSPDGKFLYVACNGDNSVAVIDTAQMAVVRQVPVGYFPYGVAVSRNGQKVLVSNWGITEYRFLKPTYDPATGELTAIDSTGNNLPDGFYVPATDTKGPRPKTSSIAILEAPGGDGAALSLKGAVYQGKPLDALRQVGDTHPSAAAIVRQGSTEILYITRSNDDSLGLLRLSDNRRLADFDLSPIAVSLPAGQKVRGGVPNALAVSPDNRRLYVAEAGIDSVAVLDTTNPQKPKLLGRIPTGWYPTALALTHDGKQLYIVNAKGVGEDFNPAIDTSAAYHPTGMVSQRGIDSNYIFGTVQKVDLAGLTLDNTTVLRNNYSTVPSLDTSVVPAGGPPSRKIRHVIFILHENKTFDSMLGSVSKFGPLAATTFNNAEGVPYANPQYTRVALNTQALATRFAAAVNYYSDAEESDAGHQFATSGTTSDYTEKTRLVKDGRGLLANKNMEPEDYPAGGYIFNNAARHGVSFKDYGDLIRISGTDTGASTPTTLNDPHSGKAGYPVLQDDKISVTVPLKTIGDVDSPVQGLGQSYFLALSILAVLGNDNANGEPHLDRNYPGYNFNISDQRRALEFIADFDRMAKAGSVPQFLYIYQPNDHTGRPQAPNAAAVGGTAPQQVADGDVALGMVVNHIMQSPIYYDEKTGEGAAIFVTWDDAQATVDHVHPHRTPLLVISPYAKPGYAAARHYSTASIVKTEELLLGLPPNNFGDLLATDLRDLFQPTYNGITAAEAPVTRTAQVVASREGKRVWDLVARVDTSAPDRDSARLGALARLSMLADDLHEQAAAAKQLQSRTYRSAQSAIYAEALRVVKAPKPRDGDD
jgi:YVTN family beta-propeller protein